jgi:hypothetical protein
MRVPNKLLFIFFVINLICLRVFANVTITKATGTSTISADKSLTGPSPAFTAITNSIVIRANAVGDFVVGQQTLTINAPANWQFKTTGVTVTGSTVTTPTLTIGTITVTSNSITIPFNVITSATSNRITISGLQVQAINGNVSLGSGNITGASSSPIVNFDSSSILGTLTQVAGTFTKLQLLLPGETAAPGTTSGKTGTVTPATAGTAYQVTVNAVDVNWNKVSVTDAINIITTDPAFGPSFIASSTTLTTGTKKVSITFKTPANSTTLVVNDAETGSTITSSTSSAFKISSDVFTKLQVLLPGETAATFTTSGKTGTPTAIVAGASITVTINAVDKNWNIVPTVNDVVSVTSTDPNLVIANQTLVSGTKQITVTLRTAGVRKFTAADVTNSIIKSITSGNITVSVGSFTKLLALAPGETFVAGSLTGKTGTPNTQAVGKAFSITVITVDDCFNKVTTIGDIIHITINNDPVSTAPADAAVKTTGSTAGTAKFNVTMRTLGTVATVTATDQADNTKTYTTPLIPVGVGAFSKLIVLMPGELPASGSTTGKSGTANPTQTAGVPFTVTVYAADALNNYLTTPTHIVSISSLTDINADMPANLNLVAGTQTFSVKFKTATTSATSTVIATDVSNGRITKSTSTAVKVVPGAFAQLLFLLPNETAKPGTDDGKTGAALLPARGTSFTIKVNAVDACYNLINTINDAVIFSSSDAGAVLPATGPSTKLTSGTGSFTVNIFSTSTSPLPTVTVKDGSITHTEEIPVSVPPTAVTDHFRTSGSGDWSDGSIWESSANGTTWQAATIVPDDQAADIVILNSYTVNIPVVYTAKANKLTVRNGGLLTVLGKLNIGTNGASVSGTVSNSGTITTASPGVLAFTSSGDYQHNFTTVAGIIPTATWDNNSTCEIVGYTSYQGTIGGAAQTFGNFIWNCPGQNTTGGVALGNVTTSINNLTILSTGSAGGSFQLVTGTGNVANITVRGDFTQTDGKFMLCATSGATASLSLLGDFNMSGTALMATSGTNSTIAFAGTTTQNFNKTDGTITNAVNFAINDGATVDFDVNVLDGSTGTFAVKDGGTLQTGNDDGITASGALGSVQSTGTRNFGTAGSFIYDGMNAQDAGTGLPPTSKNITVNNSQGVTLPSTTATYTVTGTLALTSGNLDVNSNVLAGTFSNSGSGTVKTQCPTTVSATPLPSGKTWSVGVEYYGSSNQTLVGGNYGNLTFSSSGNKTAAGDFTVTGNWSSSDGKVDLLTSNSAVQFTGTSQTLNDGLSDGGNGVVFGNVTFSNGTKTMASGKFCLATSGLLSMSNSATLAANNYLTVLSDATGTGNIGSLDNGSITGNVNVQCFMTGGNDNLNRGYRLLASPISDGTINTKFNLSFLRNSGSYLTGAGGTDNGFDVAGNPTLFLYREDVTPSNISFNAGNFRAITAINKTPAYTVGTIDNDVDLTVGNGIFYYFRGNNTTVSTSLPNDITFTETGVINQGQVTVAPWFLGGSNLSYNSAASGDARYSIAGFNLVGNPYPCSIDWNTANTTSSTTGIYAPDVDQTIYVYNGKAKKYGTYLNGTGVDGGSNIIASGQGFFVRATTSAAQLIFNESAKVNQHPSTLLLNAAAPAVRSQMYLSLSKDSVDQDENAFVFNSDAHTGYVVNEDALYLTGNGGVGLSNLSSDNRKLAINSLPFPKQTQTIQLNIGGTVAGNYKFALKQVQNIPALIKVWLVDNYLRDSLDLRANASYEFAVTGTAASFDANRFKLVMRPNPAQSVHLLSFDAVKNPSEVKINWQAENEADYTKYILQRSIDGGKTFLVLDSLTSASLGIYNDLDPKPVIGQNFYRLKQIDVLGNVTYSKVITVMYSLPASTTIASTRISLYPNPASSSLNLLVKTSTDAATGSKYKITITNTIGTVVKSGTSAQADWHSDVSSLTPGTYFIEVINLKDNSLTGRSSFIKL